MKRDRSLLSWTESAEFRKCIRRGVFKQIRSTAIGTAAFIALVFLAASLPSWLEADPEKRLPIWALPIPPTIVAVALVLIYLVLHPRFSKNRIIIKQNGIEHGPVLYRRQWLPLADISSFSIEDEVADSGQVFTFLECFQADEDPIVIEMPGNIGKDKVREVLLSLGLKEGPPEESKD